jgi:uncharacterized protein YmfQ (DUF2313 family)
VSERFRYCADDPVAPECDRSLISGDGGPRQLARVLDAARALDVVLEPEAAQGLLDRWQRPSGAAATGRRIHDHRQRHEATTSA